MEKLHTDPMATGSYPQGQFIQFIASQTTFQFSIDTLFPNLNDRRKAWASWK
jgi:hypothetical protein